MSNTHRLIWFDNQIQGSKYPNRNSLSEKFEISVRQAQRDIDYLKNSMGAPLAYSAKHRGYYYEDSHYFLPNIYVNDLQQQMLKFLYYRYENYVQTPFVKEMSQLLKKLIVQDIAEDEIPVFSPGEKVVQTYYSIYQAIEARAVLTIEYQDPVDDIVEFEIHPYKLYYKNQVDYILCYVISKEKVLSLRLDRICRISYTNENYSSIAAYDPRLFQSIPLKDPFVATILYRFPLAKAEEISLSAKRVDDLLYEFDFYDIDEFVNHLVCDPRWTNIKSPKWLVQAVKNRCVEIQKKLLPESD